MPDRVLPFVWVPCVTPPPPQNRDASEGDGPQRRPQRRLGRRLEEVAKAVGGAYCRLQMPLSLALAARAAELWLAGVGIGGGFDLSVSCGRPAEWRLASFGSVLDAEVALSSPGKASSLSLAGGEPAGEGWSLLSAPTATRQRLGALEGGAPPPPSNASLGMEPLRTGVPQPSP